MLLGGAGTRQEKWLLWDGGGDRSQVPGQRLSTSPRAGLPTSPQVTPVCTTCLPKVTEVAINRNSVLCFLFVSGSVSHRLQLCLADSGLCLSRRMPRGPALRSGALGWGPREPPQLGCLPPLEAGLAAPVNLTHPSHRLQVVSGLPCSSLLFRSSSVSHPGQMFPI